MEEEQPFRSLKKTGKAKQKSYFNYDTIKKIVVIQD